jgi:hypothetical protein
MAPNTTLLLVDGKLWTEACDALAGVAESSRLKEEPFLDRMK